MGRLTPHRPTERPTAGVPIAVAVTAAPVAAPPLAAGDLDAAAVRRIWDDVLEVAKRLKRRTHALLLSGPAQVVDVRANVLVVGFASGPVERQFNTGDNVDILQVALKEVLGVDWRIETTLSGPAAAAASVDDGESAAKPATAVADAESVDGCRSCAVALGGRPRRSGRAERAARAACREPEPLVEIVLDEPEPRRRRCR